MHDNFNVRGDNTAGAAKKGILIQRGASLGNWIFGLEDVRIRRTGGVGLHRDFVGVVAYGV